MDLSILLSRDELVVPEVNPLIAVNTICRLVLGPLCLLASWVPFKLLRRNGEFAACVMVVTNWILIVYTVVNAAIWPNDNQSTWWNGEGWCDLQLYTQFPMTTIYTACVCTIMRRLSKQVGLLRVSDLSAKEKRNRNLIQSLIIFPIPIIQAALTILVRDQRYTVMAVNGCGRSYNANTIYLVFFVIPSPIYTIAACVYAVKTWLNFREIQKTTNVALNSANSTAASRSQRAKRKLYFMALCILVPYAPVNIAFLFYNIAGAWPWTNPYSFAELRSTPKWSQIGYLKYDDVPFAEMNMNWIPIITVFIFFLFFGRWVGLGRVFPKLKEPYNPDKPAPNSGPASWGSSGVAVKTSISREQPKRPPRDPYEEFDLSLSPLPAAVEPSPALHVDFPDLERGEAAPVRTPTPAHHARPPIFNPGLKWTAPPKFPAVEIPSFMQKKKKVEPKPPSNDQFGIVTPLDSQTGREFAEEPELRRTPSPLTPTMSHSPERRRYDDEAPLAQRSATERVESMNFLKRVAQGREAS